jgi:hypothetical protein
MLMILIRSQPRLCARFLSIKCVGSLYVLVHNVPGGT